MMLPLLMISRMLPAGSGMTHGGRMGAQAGNLSGDLRTQRSASARLHLVQHLRTRWPVQNRRHCRCESGCQFAAAMARTMLALPARAWVPASMAWCSTAGENDQQQAGAMSV